LLDDDIVTVPAGWYPDPMGLPQLRWWDNYAWTEFTSAARTPLVVQDEPRLAYADDELPSRRSQRERAQAGDTRQQNTNPADLASTLRQLEPPKPQNIELSQPAPAAATAHSPEAHYAAPEAQAAAADAGHQSGQAYAGQPQQQSYQAPQQQTDPQVDPFAEFLIDPNAAQDAGQQQTAFTEQPAFSEQAGAQNPFPGQQAYAEQAAFAPSQAGFAQAHPADQFAQQAAFTAAQDGAGRYGASQARVGVHAPLAYTPFVWIIAMIPLIQLVGILLVVSAVDVAFALPFLLVLLLGPYFIGIPLAIADRRQLQHMGHRRPAHWAWSLFSPPAYLVARAISASREQGKGLTPLLVWAALSLLQVASIIAVPGILISAMPAVFAAEVEESIEADSAIAGRELAVTCPETPPVQIGGTFNCTGVLAATGEEVAIVVRLQRANGWIDWRVYGMVWENSSTAGSSTADTSTDATEEVTADDGTASLEGDMIDGEPVQP